MIIESGVYRDGRRREAPISLAATAQALQQDPDVFAWVDLYEPDPNEMASVRHLFGFHELAIEDAGAPHQRPKIERYDDSLFVVLRTLWYVDDANAVETGQVNVFVGDRTVVTVWHGARDQLFAARDLAHSMPSVLVHGPTAVLWAVCDTVVDRYQAVTRSVMNDVDEIEAAVFATRCTSEAERIYLLKREVLEMRRAIVPLRDPLGEFSRGGAHLSSSAAPFFRDVTLCRPGVRADRQCRGTARLGAGRSHGTRGRAAERRSSPDLRLGGDRGGADPGGRHLWDELRPDAGAPLGVRLSDRRSLVDRLLRCPVQGLSPGRLALT
jgi:hypothetical protein